MGRRSLRLARLWTQDRVRVPRARAGPPVRRPATEGEIDSPPVLRRRAARRCLRRGDAAHPGEYAYPGRDVVVNKVLEILSASAVHEVHNHHNFAWQEEHLGRTYWVIRKGCTPARPGQEGFVGGSMGDESVILEGVESAEAQDSFSTVHGAGRHEHSAGGRADAPSQALGVLGSRLRAAVRVARQPLPRASERAPAEGVGRRPQAGQG